MSQVFYFREGNTEPVDITLYDGTTAANITGYSSVSIFLRSEDGTAQVEGTTPSSGVTVVSAAAGTIQFVPASATGTLTFAKNLYYGYIIVVDGSSRRTSFPSDGDFVFKMLERYSCDG